MKKICSLLMIVVVIVILSGCERKNVTEKEYYGEWMASDTTYYMPISAMSDDEYKSKYFGEIAWFSEHEASFVGESIENPIYREEVINNEDFFESYRLELTDLGIEESNVKIIGIENWTNPGSTLIMKDKDTLITLWDGVFFELKRK
ncbi:hypothetical protein Amet_1443 [Alkaliphilus metalliredigens QYMF]|uniref:Lipoprotein n=1 Tax=Alkaliphilus metalliredigens (strain QYMF) TaxID=293826 RepID=A6TN74_ALKMQ|nr:hypothetical protein [Alkaliphilus metalliredigens]ABR47642.1 hypothetical protein Amet_1443 [Alkaliphilus metalliredigens QYMF]